MNRLPVAFALNLCFTLVEIIGGLLTNSLAILSDALHDLGDTLSIGVSWYFEKQSKRGRDQRFSYGYKRLSPLAALINSIILLIGSVFIISETIPRLFHPQAVEAKGVLLLAALGLLVNGAAVLRMRSGSSANERVVRLHLLEDTLGWAATLIASIVMLIFDWPLVDPLLSGAIAAFILFNVIKNLREFISIFLQGIPAHIEVDRISSSIEHLPNVQSVHDMHIWAMDSDYVVLSAHVVVEDDATAEAIIELKHALRQLIRQYNIQHETVEIEYRRERCEFVGC
jgi:cobalt-zinc-cadmium efflux system protein